MPYPPDKQYISKKRKKNHKKDPRIRLREHARRRALDKGIEFDIKTYKDVPKVPMFCPALGIPLYVGEGVCTSNSPSLDRIDSTKGYVLGNVMMMSRLANCMKQNATSEQLINFSKYMLSEHGE